MSEHILTQVADGAMRIRFHRPAKKNAFTLAMYDAVVDALKSAEADPEVRVVMMTGEGDAFTAGNDLGDFMQNPPKGEDSPVFRLLMALVDAEKPLVAAVNGVAVGIGTTMLLHCDLVYASEKARFALPFVNLGLVPEGGSTYLLPRMAGHQRAAELLMFGEQFDARTARELGLVNAVIEESRFREVVDERVRVLVEKPAVALRRTKRLLKEPARDRVLRAIRAEGELFVRSLESPEAAEAFSAFFEKRKPDFSKIRGE